jgi:hypothetical protein
VAEDLEFAWGQRLELARRVGPGRWPADVGLDEPPGDLGGEERVTGDGGADGGDELRWAGALEQEATRARAQGLVDVLVEGERGEEAS